MMEFNKNKILEDWCGTFPRPDAPKISNDELAGVKLAYRVRWLAGILRGVAVGLICIGIALPAIGEWLWGVTFGYACFSLMGLGLLFAVGYGYLKFILNEYHEIRIAPDDEAGVKFDEEEHSVKLFG